MGAETCREPLAHTGILDVAVFCRGAAGKLSEQQDRAPGPRVARDAKAVLLSTPLGFQQG